MKTVSTLMFVATMLLGPVLAPQANSQDQDVRKTGRTLDDSTLISLLVGLGYEPTKVAGGHLIEVKRNSWSIFIQFMLSGDRTRLGMNANVTTVSKPEAVTARQWMDLLVQNAEIDPSSFNYNPKTKSLLMHRVLDNRAITPAYIRVQIENFCQNVESTEKYWKFFK